MRVALVIVSLVLFTAAVVAMNNRGNPYGFHWFLYHDDREIGAIVIECYVRDDYIVIESQLHVGLLDHLQREQTLYRTGHMHVLWLPTSLLLPLFALYPLIRLRWWLRHRHERGRGFPVERKG